MNRSLLALFVLSAIASAQNTEQSRYYPDDFLFGTATASYQIEGAWNEDGKGENIWDRLTHTIPSVIEDASNGDVAADTYHNYKRDVEMMRELGVNTYRFSLSWSRILPTGFTNQVNEAGVQFYNNYIDEMLKYNITPLVTLYHWDLPQQLQEYGGFMNPMIADWFEAYAYVAFENFGDRVKHWITFNEPREICYEGYESTTKAPAFNATGIGAYICAKNLVMAHAKAYHLYKDEYKKAQKGEVGITISVNWMEPYTDSQEDIEAAELRRQMEWGIYAEPIFGKDGDFPVELVERVAQKSAEQNFYTSRLPAFTSSERKYVKGTADFFGVNHYTTIYISATENLVDYESPSRDDDIGKNGLVVPDEWPKAASPWLRQAPNSLFLALSHLNEKYEKPSFIITENGFSTYPNGTLEDEERVTYMRAALENVLDVLEAGIDLRGYMVWSLMDNFEWLEGYTSRFGLYAVDFDYPANRTARKSAFVYKKIIKDKYIDYEYDPSPYDDIGIDEGH